jgi:hypothetical protein
MQMIYCRHGTQTQCISLGSLLIQWFCKACDNGLFIISVLCFTLPIAGGIFHWCWFCHLLNRFFIILANFIFN